MSDPRDDLPPGLHASIERNTQALTRAFSAVLPAAVKAELVGEYGGTITVYTAEIRAALNGGDQ